MTNYEVTELKVTNIDTNNIIISHNNESDMLTFNCKSCGEHLGTFIGLENLALIEKLSKKHNCPEA